MPKTHAQDRLPDYAARGRGKAAISAPDLFSRTALLVGPEAMERLASVHVIIFGLGGVGSWCAESLVRSGIRHLTLVDPDTVAWSNLNRQLMATFSTVGQAKVTAMKERLLDINPSADITALQKTFSEETSGEFGLENYDYILDAIDSLKDKTALILHACNTSATFFSSMGASLKIDPQKVKVAEFWEVRGCPLGAILRKRLRQAKTFPARKFLCVYDAEVLPNRGAAPEEAPGLFHKAQINGTTAPVTGIFGLTLAGLVLQDLCR